jgi:hypothetical protein
MSAPLSNPDEAQALSKQVDTSVLALRKER